MSGIEGVVDVSLGKRPDVCLYVCTPKSFFVVENLVVLTFASLPLFPLLSSQGQPACSCWPSAELWQRHPASCHQTERTAVEFFLLFPEW